MLNVIINTCCLTDDSYVAANYGSYGRGKKTYAAREGALADMIECYLLQPGVEVIVVGEYKPGPGYSYIRDPGLTHSPEDQAQQRHTAETWGGLAAQPTLYLNDDHYLPVEDIIEAIGCLKTFDIGVLAFRREDPDGVPLADGSGGFPGLSSYVMGHGHLATWGVVSQGLWGAVVPTVMRRGVRGAFQADIQFTRELAARGVAWRRGPYALIDMDGGDFPW